MSPSPSVPLSLTNLTKRFGAHAAVCDVSLTLGAGEFFCLLGPSGCGKSTLLRLVAGFEAPSSGTLRLGDADITALPPHRRPVNMMFQSYALFPHMSVGANIAYGLSGLSRADIATRVAELLRLVRLDGFEARRPDTLSGGQRQRVALARALAREPQVLLLDEPLGALDRALREETQEELRGLQKRLGTSFIMVTHDAGEAMALADRIGIMDGGRLVQVGDAATLYERPADRFVAGLLGDVNLIEGRALAGADPDGVWVETAFGPIRAGAAGAIADGAALVLSLRPERIAVSQAPGSEAGAPTGILAKTTYLGDRIRRDIRMADGLLLKTTAAPGGPSLAEGTAVTLNVAPGAAWAIPA